MCSVRTEICGVRWNSMDICWHPQAAEWSDV